MSKRTLITIGLLGAACLTMEAQSQNEERVNSTSIWAAAYRYR